MIQYKAMFSPRLSGTLIGCLRLCRGVVTPKVHKSRHSGINGFPAISAASSLDRVQSKSTPDSKTIQSKAMYNPQLLATLIGCLRLCRGVVSPKVHKSRHSGINGFPAISAASSLVRVQSKINTGSKDGQVQCNVQPSAFRHFDRMLALVPWRDKAQGAKIEEFRDQWIPGHFDSFVLGSRARQDQHLIQR